MDPIDSRIESELRQPEVAIGDAGFSEMVMTGLPRKRISRTVARRLTLGGGAAAGSVLTSVLGAPLETAFSAFVLQGGLGIATLAAVLIVGIVAIPVAWVFYSQ